MATRDIRATICAKVLSQTASIIKTTPHALPRSTFYPTLPSPLPSSPTPTNTTTTVRVIDADTYTAAHSLLLTSPSTRQGKVAVLNLASEKRPGGGWKKGSLAQEECLCYRSTLYHTLESSSSSSSPGGASTDYYPLPELAGVYSPGVVVFREDLSNGFEEYKSVAERFVVGVVTVAGLRCPELDGSGEGFKEVQDLRLLEDKIRLTLRILALNGQRWIVLGALGCGAFKNPPRGVAEAFRRVLGEGEWKGWFEEVVFAVLSGGGGDRVETSNTSNTNNDGEGQAASSSSSSAPPPSHRREDNAPTASASTSTNRNQSTITQFFTQQNHRRDRSHNDRGDDRRRHEGRSAENNYRGRGGGGSWRSRGDRGGRGGGRGSGRGGGGQSRQDKRKETGKRNLEIFRSVLGGVVL